MSLPDRCRELLGVAQTPQQAEKLIVAAEMALLKGITIPAKAAEEAVRLSGTSPSENARAALENLIAEITRTSDPLTAFVEALILLRSLPSRPDGTNSYVEPVVTLPPDIRSGLPATISSRISDTMRTVTRLLEGASKRLLMVMAFVHMEGAQILGPYLAQATKRGVAVTLVTPPPNSNHDPRPGIQAIQNAIMATGRPELLRVCHLEVFSGSMHAKLVVADAKRAYVGSANMTGNAFIRNIEVGAFFEGPMAGALQDLFDFLLKTP